MAAAKGRAACAKAAMDTAACRPRGLLGMRAGELVTLLWGRTAAAGSDTSKLALRPAAIAVRPGERALQPLAVRAEHAAGAPCCTQPPLPLLLKACEGTAPAAYCWCRSGRGSAVALAASATGAAAAAGCGAAVDLAATPGAAKRGAPGSSGSNHSLSCTACGVPKSAVEFRERVVFDSSPTPPPRFQKRARLPRPRLPAVVQQVNERTRLPNQHLNNVASKV